MDGTKQENKRKLAFYGGRYMVFVPLLLSLVLLMWVALNNGNVPVYWAAFLLPLLLCIFLAKDKNEYCETIIRGFIDPVGGSLIVAILLAGIAGMFISNSGMVEALAQLVIKVDLTGNRFVAATFLISCLVGFTTGTSVGTIFVVGPILYPVGYLVGGTPALLVGAIISGGAFGDDFAPFSETVIACSSTQKVNLGVLFRSRAKYVVPVAVITLIMYLVIGAEGGVDVDAATAETDPRAFLFLLVPVVVIVACLFQRHLVESLSYGILAGIIIGAATGIIPLSQIISIPEPFGAGGVIVDGINDALPTAVVVLFMFSHIKILDEGGGTDIILGFAERFVKGPRSCEATISGITMLLNAITGLNAAAIMGCAPIAYQLGEKYGVGGYRRSNIMICSGATLNYLLPYMVPLVSGCMISSTYAPTADAVPVTPFEVIPAQFYPWITLAMIVFAIVTGYGRTKLPDDKPDDKALAKTAEAK